MANVNEPQGNGIEPEVLQARISVSLAQKRRLIASWLPPPTPTELAEEKERETARREEDARRPFHPMLPSLGLDCPVPQSYQAQASLVGLRGSGFMSCKEAMLNKLKPKRHGLEDPAKPVSGRKQSTAGNKNNHGGNDDDDDDEEEDEGGRSSLGGRNTSKGKKIKKRRLELEHDDEASGRGIGEEKEGEEYKAVLEPTGFLNRDSEDDDKDGDGDDGNMEDQYAGGILKGDGGSTGSNSATGERGAAAKRRERRRKRRKKNCPSEHRIGAETV